MTKCCNFRISCGRHGISCPYLLQFLEENKPNLKGTSFHRVDDCAGNKCKLFSKFYRVNPDNKQGFHFHYASGVSESYVRHIFFDPCNRQSEHEFEINLAKNIKEESGRRPGNEHVVERQRQRRREEQNNRSRSRESRSRSRSVSGHRATLRRQNRQNLSRNARDREDELIILNKREFEELKKEIKGLKEKNEKEIADVYDKIVILAENSKAHGEVLLGIEEEIGGVTEIVAANDVKLEECKQEALKIKEEVDQVKVEIISAKQDILRIDNEVKEVIRTLPEKINILAEDRERRVRTLHTTQEKNASLLTRENIMACIANQMALQRPYTSQVSSVSQRNLFSGLNSQSHNEYGNGSFGN